METNKPSACMAAVAVESSDKHYIYHKLFETIDNETLKLTSD